ncbi:hypothetical protein [Nocardia panacis]|uniref:hypothetical protein n=1 Tax=Nocardia panacis TaxID=2340916 RepID=UPI0011C3B4AF
MSRQLNLDRKAIRRYAQATTPEELFRPAPSTPAHSTNTSPTCCDGGKKDARTRTGYTKNFENSTATTAARAPCDGF